MVQRKSSRTAPKLKTIDAYLSTPTKESAHTAPIDKICLSLKQPRRYFDSEKMAQLVVSVREHGILEPLLVRPLPDGEYELVAGERRLRAAKEVGLNEVPIVSRDLDERQALQVALMENLQREDLNPVEETEAVLKLLEFALELRTDEVVSLLNLAANARKRGQELTGNVTRQIEQVEQVLSGLGRFNAESFRTNRLPLLNLPENVLEVLRQGRLAYTKALALARVKDENLRGKLLEEAIAQHLSLSEIKARSKELEPELEPTPEQILNQRRG